MPDWMYYYATLWLSECTEKQVRTSKYNNNNNNFTWVRRITQVRCTYTSHKKFSEGKQAHVGMEASKTNQTRWKSMTPQHLHTIPTSCAILPPLGQICYAFVSCVQKRVVEGSVVESAGCVVHADVHGKWVMLCNVYTEHGRYGLSCLYAETLVYEQCWVCVHGMLEFKLCCE